MLTISSHYQILSEHSEQAVHMIHPCVLSLYSLDVHCNLSPLISLDKGSLESFSLLYKAILLFTFM